MIKTAMTCALAISFFLSGLPGVYAADSQPVKKVISVDKTKKKAKKHAKHKKTAKIRAEKATGDLKK
jgi:hypothetical protein